MWMGPSHSRTAFRRFALAVAACQLLAYAAAPVVEALTETAPGPVSIERAHTASCVVLHAPDTCLACALLGVHAERPRPTCVPASAIDAPLARAALRDAAPPRAPPRSTHSRAPPADLA
jgi:hypothetical protein